MEPKDMTYEISRRYINDLVKQGVDSALIATLNGYNRSRNVAALTSCSSHFDMAQHSVEEWRSLRQIEAFFKKNSIFSSSEGCKERAFESFMETECICSQTNRRLQPFIADLHLLDRDLLKKVYRMKRYISDVLGDFTPFLNDLPHLVKVTPGATARANRRKSLPQLKMRMKLYASHSSFKYLWAIYRYYGFDGLRLRDSKSNRVEFVPKNWKTDRTIACEPEGNLFLQLAFDTFAKRRLRRFRIDLSDQSRNQSLAKHASIHNDLVTVDFSRASDTISFNTVRLLFPFDWFNFLWDVRSPFYRGSAGEGVYSKFSSMGNGSTFCIETLIFAAVCFACNSKCFSVYGDDVILEREKYEEFLALTQFLGFSINSEKTFTDGPFRESCGLDSFNGVDVTPVFIRNIDSRKAVLCHLVNSLVRICSPEGFLMEFLLKIVNENKLPLVPLQENSLSGIFIDPVRARRLGILRRRHGIDTFKAYTAKCNFKSFVDSRGYYLWFLRKNSQVLFSSPWDNSAIHDHTSQTSKAPVFDHVYVRKRVHWFRNEPMEDILYNLNEWTTLVCGNTDEDGPLGRVAQTNVPQIRRT